MKMVTNYLKNGRDPGWIELFFDLTYAVLLGRMAHLLFYTHHGEFEHQAVLFFTWIFSIAFLVWMLYTVYMNIYGNDSLWQNLISFLLMIGLFAIGIMLLDIVNNARVIVLTMSVISVIISGMYRLSKDVVPENRNYAIYKSRALFITAIIGVFAFFLEPIAVVTVTGIAYTGEHFLDELFLKRVGMAKTDSKHLVERIGIFMILIIGESFITLFNNLPEVFSLITLLPVGIILATIFMIFINYYTNNESMSEAVHIRYSQILASNFLVIAALTLLPVMTYHGIHQELDLQIYKWICGIFLFLFYFGNGMAYNHLEQSSIALNTVYWLIEVALFAGISPALDSYTGVLILLIGITFLSAVAVNLINYRKKKN